MSRRFLLVLVAAPLLAQTTVEERIRRIENGLLASPVVVKGEPVATATIAARMAALHVPAVSVAFIHEGRIEWARAWGATPDTLFQAASISKPVAALAVLRLAQSGKLDLDADVNRYLKTWKVPANDFTTQRAVTLQELLSHTAGMTVHGFPGYEAGARVPTVTQILNGEKPANTSAIRVDTLPGSIWRYSGGGYVVAQLVLEDVTGQPFAKLMQDTVLGPIGMTRSTYEQPLPAARLSEIATPFRQNGKPVDGGPHVYPEMAPAGLWTTPSDLARYAIEVQRALAGKSDRVINQATARRMLTPIMDNQGIGPGVGGGADHRYFSHGGANEGYRCNLTVYNEGDGLVVMTNSDSGARLANEILVAVAREYNWPDFNPERTIAKIDPNTLDAFAGQYRLNPNATLTVTREANRLFVQLTGQPRLEAFPQSERSFFLKVVDAQLDFEIDGQGKAAAVVLHQNGRDQRAIRLE